MRALVVDDDRTNRLVLRALLSKEGFSVSEAENGRQAVDEFHRDTPDLVLMDVMMPVMDGYEATRLIKEMSGDRFVPVIFLTALNDEASLTRCVSSGGDDFLTKPYNRVILRSKIQALERVRRLYHTLKIQRDELSYHQRRLMREQEVAERVFSRIIHSATLQLPYIRHVVSPMSLFNGDLLLAARNPSGGLNVVVGDFTGHGLPAAVGTVPVAEAFYAMTSKGYGVGDIVAELNRKLKQLLPVDIFFAACCLGFDFERGTLSYWNGGLPDGYVLDLRGQIRQRLVSKHPPLGVLSVEQFQRWPEIIELPAGERVFFYSDGVVETHAPGGGMFGEERLEALLQDGRAGQSAVDQVLNALESFRHGLPQGDDITMIEITMQDQADIGPDQEMPGVELPKGAMEWSFHLELEADALREFDPLPHLMQLLMEVQSLYTHRERIYTVLAELYTNALDHGVLKLDSAMKATPEGFIDFYHKRAEKLAALEHGWVRIELAHQQTDGGGQLRVMVSDSGEGFAVDSVAEGFGGAASFCGRGIPLLRSLCSQLSYEERGSRAVAHYDWEAD